MEDKYSDGDYLLGQIDWRDCRILQKATESLKQDREFILKVVQLNGEALEYLDETFTKDREIVLKAVQQYGKSLRFADETLKKDREIVLQAVKQNGMSLYYVDEELKNDREIVLQAVKHDGQTLRLASETLRKDSEFMIQAAKQHIFGIAYADESLKKDAEFMLQAAQQNVYALDHADETLKKDREFILRAVKQNGMALQCADEDLKKDGEIILQAVKQNVHAITNNETLIRDREFILQAVQQNGMILKYVDEVFTKDREIIMQAVKQNGMSLQFADEIIRKDREIVLHAVKQSGMALQYADEIMKKDREIVSEATKKDGNVLKFISTIFTKDREIVIQAVQQNGLALQYADEILKKDRDVVFQAVKQNELAVKHADDSLRNDIILIYSLSKHNIELSRNFSPDLTQILEESNNIHAKISKDIIELYSQQLNSESELFYCVEIPNYKPSKTVNKKIFNLNPSYSIEFIEKLIIYQILKRLHEREVTDDVLYCENINYHLFCFKLDRFLTENIIQPTSFKDLRKVVDTISQKFDISHYSKKECNDIMYLFTKWTDNENNFNNYRNIMSKYNELHGDSSKIFTALIRYYKKFKSDYNFISILGQGGEGVVFKILHRTSNILMAIKFKFETEESEKSASELINLLKRTDMKGKIKCYDCGLIERHLYSVMELGEESLFNYIQSNTGVYRNLPSMMTREKLIEILQIYIKVLESVQSIHDHNVLHRDLDPQNIVKLRDDYKIIDFETSKVIKTGNSITIARGKYAYMSPEVSHDNYNDELLKSDDDLKLAHNDGNITIKCDIFSMGCILLKLLTNCPLQLDERFVNDLDLSKYTDNYMYFTAYGKYFYTVVTTSEGEMKLHYAIQKIINTSIQQDFGINKILIRCIITMIQRDSSKRLDCYSYKTTLENVIKYLNGKEIELSNLEQDMNKYKEITPLKSYSQLLEDINKLNQENSTMAAKLELLEEEIRKLKSKHQ